MAPKAKQGSATPFRVSPTMALILHGRDLETRLEADLKSRGLSLRRMGLLGHLLREPGISFSTLARRAGIKVQSLHPIIEGLQADGLVETVGGVGQGRAAHLELTPKGRAALDEGETVITGYDVTVFAEAEWKKLGASLREVAAAEFRRRMAPH